MKRVLKIKFVLTLLLATCCLADVRNVPMDYLTIQAAIDDSNDGDTVLVAPGTYTGDCNRDLDFKGKAITVKSDDGYETCIIDCQGSEDEPHRGFFFHSGEDANSVLQGFTIANGYESLGGGIYCHEASPYIKDCLITANTVFYDGGGISCYSSNSTIVGCFIVNNEAYSGGGISTWGQDILIKLINCFIIGNNAEGGGGVLCPSGVSLDILNCTISDNHAEVGGGIFYCLPKRRINNSIIYGNIASTGSEIAIDSPPVGCAGCGENTLEIAYSVIGSDPNGIYFTSCNGYLSGQWLQVDPHFAQPGYWETNTPDDPNDDIWIEGDYHLKSQAGRFDPKSQSWPCTESGAGWVIDDVTSPCIDAGDPNSPVAFEPEPNGGRINMGAYGGIDQASKSYLIEP